MAWDADGYKRSDGVFIRQGADSGWTIYNGDIPLGYCPCCHKRIATDRAARMVADVVWPEKEEVDGADNLGGDAA